VCECLRMIDVLDSASKQTTSVLARMSFIDIRHNIRQNDATERQVHRLSVQHLRVLTTGGGGSVRPVANEIF